ncbi:MAG TPA: DUF5916 domain-containing protein [Polyangiaceae bacterium]|nr:DUF5916 domain-containing protein [Polyangiaceae bacterium]
MIGALSLAAAVLGVPPTPHLNAARVDNPPILDGKLDDPAWAKAEPSSAFLQKFPSEGQDPTERTTLRIVYDDANVYVAFDCEQRTVPVVERLTRRGRLVESDWVSVAMGTRADGKSAFEFLVNASGVRVDALRFNDTDKTEDRDENWEAETAVREGGWSAEFRIPLHLLRFASSPEQTWDLQARRYVSELQETDEWAFFTRSAGGEVSHYGKLHGLRGLTSRAPLELRPFVLGKMERRELSSEQLDSGTTFAGSAGLDLKWHPTNDLTLDLTVNPDFAQVEADQQVLNLSSFETYFPEKRPFFLEGVDVFTTPIQLLYTRRIGRAPRAPRVREDVPFEEQVVRLPTARTIFGASKLTGQIGKGWSVGTLQAVTAEGKVDVEDVNGSRYRRLVEPLTAHQVLRLRRDIGDNGHVGVMMTATTYAEKSGDYPTVPPSAESPDTTQLCPNAVDPTNPVQSIGSSSRSGPSLSVAPGSRCFSNAYVGGLDWRWRSSNGDWAATGQVVGSTLQGGAPRHVPDGTVIEGGDVGPAVSLYARKEGGGHWLGGLYGDYAGRKFDVNDLGFLTRANQYQARAEIEYREMNRTGMALEAHARLQYIQRLNLAGVDIGGTGRFASWGTLTNFWKYYADVHARRDYFDDREVGDGTALQRGGWVGHELWLETDRTKKVSADLWTATDFLGNGKGFAFYAEGGVMWRVVPPFDLAILPTANYTTGEPRFVGTGPNLAVAGAPGEYLFGRLTARSFGTTLRATYTFTPRLTLQTYAQLLLASGHYTDFSIFQATGGGPGGQVRLDTLRPYSGGLVENPDFIGGVLNLNVVLRWEYRLGATAYLVYTRAQSPDVSLGLGDIPGIRFSTVGNAPAVDVILLKISYWWS